MSFYAPHLSLNLNPNLNLNELGAITLITSQIQPLSVSIQCMVGLYMVFSFCCFVVLVMPVNVPPKDQR